MRVRHALDGMYEDADLAYDARTNVYTAFCPEAGNYEVVAVEEIDVHARSTEHARRIAEEALKQDYEPGMTVREIVGPRVGFYF